MKVAAIVIGAILLLVAVMAGAGYVWWQNNKLALKAEVQAATDEGRAVGSQGTASQCVDATVERTKGCDGIMCAVRAKSFIRGCMRATKVDAAFCRGVPREGEIMNTVRWTMDTCSSRGADNEICPKVVRDALKYCRGVS
ncbi:MAG TPA: hypothetical protein VKA50_05385 [Gammaproteobacteria bacterium]|nr:hypothetical protein [Gammaproteobacteria bacterium]